MEINSTMVIASAVIAAISALAIAIVAKKQKKAVYDEEKQKAFLESIRSSIEREMYSLNDRMIQNEERWRDVNHLLLRNEYSKFDELNNGKQTVLSDFLKSNGITQNDLLLDSRLIFVLTPFHERFETDFRIIKEVCSRFGFNCIRGDEKNFKSDIFPEILKIIVKSRLIIANVNGRNPNVMYELGIAQALDKPVLLLSREPENLPIDIKSKRFLIYNSYQNLEENLRKTLSSIT
ncbi:hypothetical protein [uncultured Sphingobacterium sp.]|uniref:hypothetical protein n=1 Tax=uncultured Sphingobacterium sp. TaxID=182688 RepID=UPI0025E7754F|nr:hypothetical protein [uncultured Sphingobacterium sp.]